MFPRSRAFTLIELLVVIGLISLLIGLLLPALASARLAARQIQSTTQVRGIQASMVLFSQSNHSFFPGRTSSGQIDQPAVEQRYTLLLEQNYLTGVYLINPVEQRTLWTGGKLTSENYSYALLMLRPTSSGTRREQWRQTDNPQAPIVSDRARGNLAGIMSVYTHPPVNATDWRGSVAWNDNHATFESTHILTTRFGDVMVPQDNLFEDEPIAGIFGSNAAMVWTGQTGMIE